MARTDEELDAAYYQAAEANDPCQDYGDGVDSEGLRAVYELGRADERKGSRLLDFAQDGGPMPHPDESSEDFARRLEEHKSKQAR